MIGASVFPPEVIGDIPRITVIGRDSVRIEQHHGLSLWQEDEVAFRVAGGEVVLQGRDLQLTTYTGQEATVAGRLSGMLFRAAGSRKAGAEKREVVP